MLRVEIQSAPTVVTLHCFGRLVLGVEAETLRCIATSRPERHLMLDLSCIYAIDAAGLGLLVELHKWARERSARLTVVSPSGPAHKLLALTSLDRVLDLCGQPEGRPCDEWQTMTA